MEKRDVRNWPSLGGFVTSVAIMVGEAQRWIEL